MKAQGQSIENLDLQIPSKSQFVEIYSLFRDGFQSRFSMFSPCASGSCKLLKLFLALTTVISALSDCTPFLHGKNPLTYRLAQMSTVQRN